MIILFFLNVNQGFSVDIIFVLDATKWFTNINFWAKLNVSVKKPCFGGLNV